MDGHIDWLSFTIETDESVPSLRHLAELARRLLREKGSVLYEYVFRASAWNNGTGRPPFRYAVERGDRGARIFGGGQLQMLLFELTGRGCEGLRDGELAASILGVLGDSITRFDYAVDVRTGVLPHEFVDRRMHRVFRSISDIRSDTGQTVYVGSPKSDRFARVYRYAPPHPRARLLRIEHVFRRGMARAAVREFINAGGGQKFEAQLGNTWGWAHPVWQPSTRSDEKIRAPIVSREHEDTVLWLYKQVAPALRKVHDAGAIDLEDWWKVVFGDYSSDGDPPLEGGEIAPG